MAATPEQIRQLADEIRTMRDRVQESADHGVDQGELTERVGKLTKADLRALSGELGIRVPPMGHTKDRMVDHVVTQTVGALVEHYTTVERTPGVAYETLTNAADGQPVLAPVPAPVTDEPRRPDTWADLPSPPEPADGAAVADRGDDTWVRVGDQWWPLTDGPGWDPQARDGLGTPRAWAEIQEHGPFATTDDPRAVRARDRVRRAYELDGKPVPAVLRTGSPVDAEIRRFTRRVDGYVAPCGSTQYANPDSHGVWCVTCRKSGGAPTAPGGHTAGGGTAPAGGGTDVALHPAMESALEAVREHVGGWRIADDGTGVADTDAFLGSLGGFVAGVGELLDVLADYLGEGDNPVAPTVAEQLRQFDVALVGMANQAVDVYRAWRDDDDNAHDLRRASGEVGGAHLFNVRVG